MKKYLFLFLLMLLPGVSWAEDVDLVRDGDYLYSINDPDKKNLRLVGVKLSVTEITVPATVTDNNSVEYKVDEIASKTDQDAGVSGSTDYVAIHGNTNITKVTFAPSSNCTTISYNAFENCTALATVENATSVTTIRSSAFSGCSKLSSISLDNVQEVENLAFENCALTSITMLNVKSIGDYAFYSNPLKTIEIDYSGSGTTSIGKFAFAGNAELTTLYSGFTTTEQSTWESSAFDATCTATVYTGFVEEAISNNASFKEIYTLSYTVSNIKIGGRPSVTGSNEAAIIKIGGQPSVIDFKPAGTIKYKGEDYTITTVGDGTNTNVVSAEIASIGGTGSAGKPNLTLPSTVTKIADFAFKSNTAMTTVKIESGVQDIGICAFENNTSLETVTLQGVKNIHSYAFRGNTEMTTANLQGVKTIYYYAFGENTKLTSVTFDSSLETIDKLAFTECSVLTGVEFPTSIVKIGNYAFSECSNLTDISIEGDISKTTSIGVGAFYESGVKTLKLKNFQSIETGAFQNTTNLQSVDLDNCGTLGKEAFKCTSANATLKNVDLDVTTIGDNAFENRTGIQYVTIGSSITNIGSNAFASCWKLSIVKSLIEDPRAVTTGNDIFEELSSEAVLHVPYGTKALYEAIPEWNVFKEIVEMEPTTTDVSQMTEAVYMKPSTATIGRDAKLEVRLKSSVPSAGYQFDVVLPAGVTPVSAQMTSNNHSTFTLSTSTPEENVYRVVVYSQSAKTMAAGDDAAINLTVHVADNVATGDYSLVFRNASISTDDNQSIRPAKTMTLLTIDDVKTGDVNHDNYIDVADVVDLVNYILGKASADFVVRAANVNSDGYIDVADVVGIVNIILGKTSGARSMVKHEDSVQGTVGDAVSLWNGEHGKLSLLLDNAADYIAAQFDVRLSEGQTLEQVTKGQRARGHQLATAKMGEGVYRVLLYTIGDRTFSGQSGEVVSLGVAGEGSVSVENITFITAGESRKKFDDLSSQLTGIGAVLNGSGEVTGDTQEWYDLQGRRLETAPTSKGIYLKNGKKVVVK